MSAPDLRLAHALDAGALGDILTEAVAEHPWKPRLYSAAEDISHASQMIRHGWVTVALSCGKPAGFIAREEGYIHALFVARKLRGRGLGGALIEDAKKCSAQLDLWTFAQNHAARRFYRRSGFVEQAQTDVQNDEGLPEIRLVWKGRKA